MAIYQQNDRHDPTWVLLSLEQISQDETWVSAGVSRAKTFLKLYINKEIDAACLKFNLLNIKNTRHEYATYEENIRKNILDDILNPLIDIL